jgi:hypothetical protein
MWPLASLIQVVYSFCGCNIAEGEGECITINVLFTSDDCLSVHIFRRRNRQRRNFFPPLPQWLDSPLGA